MYSSLLWKQGATSRLFLEGVFTLKRYFVGVVGCDYDCTQANYCFNLLKSLKLIFLCDIALDDDDRSELQNESLRYLEGTRRLFFRKCATFPPGKRRSHFGKIIIKLHITFLIMLSLELSSFKPKNKRGIWNSSGRVLYYTGQKTGFICRGCHYSGFIHEVVDYSGKTVIIASGRQFLFGFNSVQKSTTQSISIKL